ncbi:hypothetical protein S7335_4124 [Synechococcus sp. PCC 7335]|uniref:hypothetical protein n=1 Tax=Synechococcus sp. (strain ATCC 29403 / PCC 7335) TaxID=91464 RepID=UPI00017EB131|nr:hypothetical protein [Synechococcus sp. PCC 7335]EDX86420.1 hypothetical protein S7335_4124 [Synechococcus sp. PCC 7335]
MRYNETLDTNLSRAALLSVSALIGGLTAVNLPDQVVETAIAQMIEQRTPVTYMTPQNADEIAVQITDGNFYFYDILQRSYGNLFQATSSSLRVMYDRDTGRVTVISDETGEEFYNYTFSESSSGSSSSTSSPTTYTTVRNADEIDIQVTDGGFAFSDTLEQTAPDTFIAQQGQVRVVYYRDQSRIAIINVVSGDELYNYQYSDVDEGTL